MTSRISLVAAAGFLSLPLSGCGDEVVERAETAMRSTLKDPSSAQFQSVERCGTGATVKGSLNAKNSFGAYTGFVDFYSDGQTGATEADQFETFIRLSGKCTAEILQSIPKPHK
jgi:hypothetical protein